MSKAAAENDPKTRDGPRYLRRLVRWAFPKRPETLPETRKRILAEFSEEFNSGSRDRMMELKRQIDEIDLLIKSSPNVELTRGADQTQSKGNQP